jgi:hypothetical protein
MNEHDVMCQVRQSFSGLYMDVPVEKVFARSRIRRRRRLSALTAAAAATAGAAAALALIPGGPAPARADNPSPSPRLSPRLSPAELTAFSVTSGPGDSTTLTIRKGARLDPSALRQALARHGIPALVTVGTFCRSTPGSPAGSSDFLHASTLADGSDVLVINGHAIPSGSRLSVGYFPRQIHMGLIKDGAPLSCSATSRQPVVHIVPSGTPIRG